MDNGTHDARKLGKILFKSHNTIRQEFQRIAEVLETHTRYASISLAEQQGWIKAEPPHEHNSP